MQGYLEYVGTIILTTIVAYIPATILFLPVYIILQRFEKIPEVPFAATIFLAYHVLLVYAINLFYGKTDIATFVILLLNTPIIIGVGALAVDKTRRFYGGTQTESKDYGCVIGIVYFLGLGIAMLVVASQTY